MSCLFKLSIEFALAYYYSQLYHFLSYLLRLCTTVGRHIYTRLRKFSLISLPQAKMDYFWNNQFYLPQNHLQSMHRCRCRVLSITFSSIRRHCYMLTSVSIFTQRLCRISFLIHKTHVAEERRQNVPWMKHGNNYSYSGFWQMSDRCTLNLCMTRIGWYFNTNNMHNNAIGPITRLFV